MHKTTFPYRGGGLLPAVGMHSPGEKVLLTGYCIKPTSVTSKVDSMLEANIGSLISERAPESSSQPVIQEGIFI